MRAEKSFVGFGLGVGADVDVGVGVGCGCGCVNMLHEENMTSAYKVLILIERRRCVTCTCTAESPELRVTLSSHLSFSVYMFCKIVVQSFITVISSGCAEPGACDVASATF